MPPPRRPRPSRVIRTALAKADTTRINPQALAALRTANATGLLDTLVTMAGFTPHIGPLVKKPTAGAVGAYSPEDSTLSLALDLTPTMLTETLAHEFGHAIGSTSADALVRFPTVRRAHRQRGKQVEPSADAFMRALLGLRESRKEGAERGEVILQAYERGLSPTLSPFEQRVGEIRGTQQVASEILAHPLFSEHPLTPERKRLLAEAPTLFRFRGVP